MSIIADWRARGILTEAQAVLLEDVDSGRRFSVRDELRAFLYLGTALFVGDVSWLLRTHFQDLGEPAIVAALLLLIGGCAYYCMPRTPAYSHERVEPPTSAYDYLIYFACGLTGVLLTYLETRHHWLGANWDWYLLVGGAAALGLAYRCDNRLVLAVGLVHLGGWWARRIGPLLHLDWSLPLLAFALPAAAAGLSASRGRIKPHFADTYYTVAFFCAAAAMLPEAMVHYVLAPQFYVLLGLCAAAIYYALTQRRFAFFLYGAGCAYVVLSAALLHLIYASGLILLGMTFMSFYGLITPFAMIALMLKMRATLKEKE